MNEPDDNLTQDHKHKVLQVFLRALEREAHVLKQRPDLFWQQFYNRLQWEDELKPILSTEYSVRKKSAAPAWIRLDTPFRESPALIRTLSGHTDYVNACDVSPDGRRIASVGADHTLRIWEASSGQQLLVAHPGLGSLNGCTFSSDGSRVLVASINGGLVSIDINTGHLLSSQKLNCTLLKSRFSPGCQFLVSAVGNRSFHIWETSTGRLTGIPEGHAGTVTACSFSPDLHQLLTSSWDGTCRIWETTTSRLLGVFMEASNGFQASAYAPDGNTILTVDHKGQLSIWEKTTGNLIRTAEGSIDGVNLCLFSPQGQWIVAAQRDGLLKVWETASGRLALLLEGHARSVNSFAFSPDGRWLVSASDDSTLRIWELAPGRTSRRQEGHAGKINDCAFSPDGTQVISAGEDACLRLWQAVDGKFLQIMKAHYNEVVSCSFSQDGRQIFSAGWDGFLKIWDTASGQVVRSLGKSGFGLHSFSLSPDGSLVALYPHSKSTSEEEEEPDTFQLWDTVTGQMKFILEGHDPNYSVMDYCFSPQGDLLLSAGQDGALRTWDTRTGQTIRVFEIPDASVYACAFSPDGRRFASASDDGTLRIWDLFTSAPLFCIQVQTIKKPGSCRFSPDGRFLLSNQGNHLDVWEATTGEPLTRLMGHRLGITAWCFTPDGCYVISASEDRTVRFWRLDNGDEIAHLSLPSALVSMSLHPWRARLVLGDTGGIIYLADIQKLGMGPILVTPEEWTSGLLCHCPACQQRFTITKSQTDAELNCPTPGCGLRLKINPFMIEPPVQAK